MSAWLTALLGRILNRGTNIPLGYGVNYVGALRARLNTSTKFTEVDVDEASIAPTHLTAEDGGAGATFVMHVTFESAAAGTADDVTGGVAPVACRILDRWADIDANIGASTLRVRNATGGGGDALSGSISSAALCNGQRASSSTFADESQLAEGETWYVRRSDRGVAGTVYMLCVRTS